MQTRKFEDILQGDCFTLGDCCVNNVCLQRVPQGLIVLRCDIEVPSEIKFLSYSNYRDYNCKLLNLTKGGFEDIE